MYVDCLKASNNNLLISVNKFSTEAGVAKAAFFPVSLAKSKMISLNLNGARTWEISHWL